MEKKGKAKVNLMARAGSRTPKYQVRQTRQTPALSYHRAMPTTHTTGYASPPADQTSFPVHGGGQNTSHQAPPLPPPLNLTTVVVAATLVPAAVASSASINRSSENGCAKVCEGCGGPPKNGREAFLYGDKYCGTCFLRFQRNG